MEKSDDIIREMRTLGRLDEKSTDKIPRSLQALGLRTYADRIESALKRMADSIHRAMVIIAGIEMENPDNPPRLWTALEDAWDALCEALGTDGDVSSDVAEAKAIGRHFVVKPFRNAEKMREALVMIQSGLNDEDDIPYLKELKKVVDDALSSTPRNCDIGTSEDQYNRFVHSCTSRKISCKKSDFQSCTRCYAEWSQMPYEGKV